MTELAKEAFTSRNYHLAVELYERCLKQQGSSYEVLLGYGDSLLKCGRVKESIEIYSRCSTAMSVPADRLKHLATALLEDMIGIGTNPRRRIETSFACPLCEGALYQPMTAGCGHTYCRNCVDPSKNCHVCGVKIAIVSETNVLVQRLVEKWWPREVEASRARHEGDILMRKGHLGQALERYNLAVHLAPNSPLHLSNRAHVLLLLNRPLAALTDADHAVRLRPDWGKGHYRRGIALSALGRHEEALYALCISVAIDKNPQAVRHELIKILHRVLSPKVHRQNFLSSRTPYSLTKSALRTRNRHQLMNSNHSRRATLNRSDSEDNSSGEEEFIQTINRRIRSSIVPQVNTKLQASLDRVYQDIEKLKRIESRPAEILLPTLSGGTVGELDCILCCRLLWKPVTTPCGHTYCWMCLDRCLDYSSACPLCVTSLADYLASSQKTVTDFVEKALKTVAPTEYTSRAVSHQLELVQGLGLLNSEQIAVFICTTAFPCIACPLFVYEPRYRLMVRRCVDSGMRQFGIAACLNKEATGTKRYAEYGTILDIRDRVLLKDGCSILSTVGGRRFRVLSGGEKDGYDTAQVEFIRDTVVQQDQLLNLLELHNKVRAKGRRWWDTVSISQKSEIQRVFGRMPDVEEDWPRLPDGPSWTWWLLAILPLGPQLQVGILGTTSLEKRLRAIEKTLDHMEQRQLTIAAAPSEQTTTSSSICRDGRAITETAMSVIQQS
ncbi:LON peptidase N-terminal domain and RING finger protein 3 [Trachymyrmex septentrionalis]|uniref:LON peptidase N-terminal domain and RING finger protein 3 n=1 Tax=Trachymyrmex septentrionalis TaxID=34720 RepID=A0A195FJL1_9HYME|nr:PREDICTED: LON peptidase N-terminal domain and RING finger protein 3 [Trachymyrmex septentrionalis]KYN40189.1 LON peptidase N-terminal domain and RING finger protein 3 [Trachymyrmex septentrionalis]